MGAATNPERLVIATLVDLVISLVLIIGMKLQAIPAILISIVTISLIAGMPYSAILESTGTSMGNTLKGIALPAGLESMFGVILEVSGGIRRVAITPVDKFGESKAAWALGIMGLVIVMLVFFGVGLIILIPLAFSLAKRAKKSTLCYAIPLLTGLAVGRAFIPLTPGPILMANMLGVELGYVIIVGLLAGTVAITVAGPTFGKFIDNRICVPVSKSVQEMEECDETKLPGLLAVVSIILIPLVLTILSTISEVIPAMVEVQPVLAFIGEPFIVLAIATLAAMIVLGTKYGYNREESEKVVIKSLEPTGMILLVTVCSGVPRYVFQDSGLGEVIGNVVAGSALPLVVMTLVVMVLTCISAGFATVVMTMGAGIIVAMLEIVSLSSLHLTCVTVAIVGGATVMSHFDGSGF